MEPAALVITSGKRKSGKDYFAAQLQKILGDDVCEILRLSEPLKAQYAAENQLDYAELLTSGPYKEQHRAAMITWGETQRRRDPGVFCRQVAQKARRRVWIVSDARRRSDLDWFRRRFGRALITVRICAREDVRRARGWVFTSGVDDAESECDLDDVGGWTHEVANDGDVAAWAAALEAVADSVKDKLRAA